MAKKIQGYIRLQLPAGAANPAPPVGPALGAQGVNIMAFCKEFNAATKGDADGLRNEAADLVFHLAVLLESVGLGFEDVLAELERREGLSGLAEKAARSGVTAPEQGDRNAG